MLVVRLAYLSLKTSNRFFIQGKEVQQFIKSKQHSDWCESFVIKPKVKVQPVASLANQVLAKIDGS